MALSTDPAKLELLSTGIAEILASRPSTLLHGDCRGDNVSTELHDSNGVTRLFVDVGLLPPTALPEGRHDG
eukprot:COSAG04_NODE_259_length_18733_cov_5.191371_3_plen_71_part_00